MNKRYPTIICMALLVTTSFAQDSAPPPEAAAKTRPQLKIVTQPVDSDAPAAAPRVRLQLGKQSTGSTLPGSESPANRVVLKTISSPVAGSSPPTSSSVLKLSPPVTSTELKPPSRAGWPDSSSENRAPRLISGEADVKPFPGTVDGWPGEIVSGRESNQLGSTLGSPHQAFKATPESGDLLKDLQPRKRAFSQRSIGQSPAPEHRGSVTTLSGTDHKLPIHSGSSSSSRDGAEYDSWSGLGFDEKTDATLGGSVDSDGEKFLGGSASAGGGLYGEAGVSQSGKIGNVTVRNHLTGEASLATEGEVRAGITDDGATLGLEGFSGARAGATVGSDVGPVGYGTTGEVWAGAGVEAGVNAGYDDGKLRLGAKAGAGLGVGGKVAVEVEVDVEAIGDGVREGAEKVGDWGREVGYDARDLGREARDRAEQFGQKAGDHIKNTGRRLGSEAKEAASDLGRHAKRASNTVGDKAKQAGNTIKKGAGKAKSAVKKAGNKVKGAVKNTGKKVGNFFKGLGKKKK